MVGSPTKRALVPQRGAVLGGGDTAAGPLTRRTSQVSAQLRAISLEYSHSEMTTATLGWHHSRKLGAGCYGAVYRGELKDGSEVAIKAIDLGVLMGKGESPEDAGFDEEVQMLSKFRHPNLVTLLGWGQQGLSRYLVYEFLAGGDVFQRLHKSRQPNTEKLFVWHERLSVCLDAATGLSHMHNSTPKAFHRDIKSANILLDRHGTAKMADFGLSCTSGQTGALHITVKTISGTPGYKCPLYERTGRFTEGSEVYSFGMVLLEVLTGLDPSSADPHLPGGIIYPVADTIAPNQPGAIDRCTRNLDSSATWPVQLAHEFGTLALRCVAAHDERSRPHFVEIVRSLRSMMERFPPSSTPTPPQPQPAAVDAGNKAKTFTRAKTFPAAKEAPAAVVAANVAPRPGLSLAVKAAAGVPAGGVEQSEETPFQLEIVMATGLDMEALAPEFRRMPLTAAATGDSSPGAVATAPVGRHHQPEYFEAWLPDLNQRSCISRKAFEVSWYPGNGTVWLLACGTNPMSVDGKVATKNTRMPLRPGSEVCFTYELKVLLRLRFTTVASPAPQPAKEATAPSQPSRWCVDRTYQLAGDGIDERLPGRAVVLEGVASVSDAVEKLNHGSLRSPGGFCIVYSATKGAYFLLYQPGFREAAFASLGVSEEVVQPGSQEQGILRPQYEVRMVEPKKEDAASPQAVVQPVIRMESAPQEGASASTTARSGATSSGGSSTPAMTWRLICIHAEGLGAEDLAALPANMREVSLTEGTTQVGRHHQPQHFEAWLPEPTLRFCISRTHFDLVASGSSLVLTNRSGNLLCVDREPVSKGEPRALAAGQTLSFARQEGPSLLHFLVLQVRSAEALVEDCAAPLPRPLLPERPETVKVVCAANIDITTPVAVTRPQAGAKSPSPQPDRRELNQDFAFRPTAATSSRSRSPDKPGRSSTGHVAALAASGAPTPVRRPRGSSALAGVNEEAHPAAMKMGVDPKIILELAGEGVLDVPISRRTIGPVSLGERPLLVGTRHQPELHQCAISEECLTSLSRDHFCVAYEGNEFWLLALTSNHIWRDRDGEVPVQLARDDLVTLLPGDRIALGTGSDVSSAELARRKLCWHFHKVDETPLVRASGSVSPRKAALAESPPRWLSVGARQGGAPAGPLDQTARDPAPRD